ncbi:MAG: hypothetical protein PVG70_01145 [Desulfobacterales bacterium]|jgi:hypothetical protein
MTSKVINLDNDAEELYAQLDGVEIRKLKKATFSGSDRLAQSLQAEQRHYDALRSLIASLAYHVGACLTYPSGPGKEQLEKSTFAQLEKIFGILKQNPRIGNTALIRYRGAFGEFQTDNKADYEVLYGDITLDNDLVRAIAKQRKENKSQILEQMQKAFASFWKLGINNLLIKIPTGREELARLWISLLIAAQYFEAVEKKSPITIKMKGKLVSIPLVHDESNNPDLNLTLLAALNGIHPQKMHALVGKVDAWMRSTEAVAKLYQYLSIYDTIVNTKRFRSQRHPSPIEVNNIKWLMVDNEKTQISDGMAQVARLVMENSGGSSTETARVLKSVYGEDYEKIDSQQVVQRLQVTTGLLNTIEQKTDSDEIETEVLSNVEKRLDKVSDDVYDNLHIEGNKIKAQAPDRETFIGKVHAKVVKMVSFRKKRSVTKKKMTQMVHQVIDFGHEDFETVAKEFNVSVKEAEALINMLKSCFDSQGNFKKSVFGRIIPELERYERKIFEFLWHNLKESLHQKDRAAFLDSLQLLVDRLKQPKNSISVLLNDLYQNPSVIRFADRKAFMLGNRLIRKYSQEIVSYQITPEDILLEKEGVDHKIASYAAWKIDKNQDKLFEKIRTVHRRLLEILDSDKEDNRLLSIQDLLTLEREIYIFLALVGGNTGRSVLLSALKEYGHPESDLYQLTNSQRHMADLLQLLKIVIRGISRVGDGNEVTFIEDIIGRLEVFSQLTNNLHEKDLINQIKECAVSAKQELLAKA